MSEVSLVPALSPADIAQDLEGFALRARWFAHRPENALRVLDDERVEVRFPGGELRFAARLPDWESRIVWTYTVEVIRDERPGSGHGERTIRHLSVQQSVPRDVTQGQVNVAKDAIIGWWSWVAPMFFPGESAVACHVRAEPFVVVGHPVTRMTSVRTPIILHFVCEGREAHPPGSVPA